MALSSKKRLLLAKIETTYGTDAVPTGAANAIMTSGLTITPLAGSTVSRDIDRAVLGNDTKIHVGSHVAIELGVEIAGAGAAGSAPAYAPLLRACGFSETLTATIKAEYKPVSGSFESLSMYFSLDGQRHKLLGARGSVSLELNAQKIPMYKFKFLGLWDDPASAADPTPTWSAFQVPLPITKTNTPTATLHAVAAILHELSLDMACKVTPRMVVGAESIELVDREPAGNVKMDAPALSTKNWFTTAKANTTGVMSIVHGTAAGNIVQLDAPAVQLLEPKYSEADGVVTLDAGLSLIPTDAGNDELVITVK